jgi:type II secretion system protein G
LKGLGMATSQRQGFSLIEIMIVIMIIGVLAAGAFGGLRYLQRVKESSTRQKLANLDTMIEQYSTTVGEYPSDLQELIDGPSNPQLVRKWGEAIASADDLADAWKNPFVYTLNPKGTRPPYELYSIGYKGDSQIFSPRSQEASQQT